MPKRPGASPEDTELLAAIFDHIPVMISLFDADDRLVFANREWETAFGMSLEEARKVDFLAEAYPDPEIRREVSDFISRADRTWADSRLRSRSGKMIDASWTRFRLSDGTSIGFGIDITTRKHAEEALRESEERWRLLVGNAPNIVLTTAPDLTIRYINHVLPGYDREQVIGTSALLYVSPEHHAIYRAAAASVLATGERTEIETGVRGADGTRLHFRTSIGPTRQDGLIDGLLLIGTDLTEQKRAESRLEQSLSESRALSSRLASVREEECARISREVHDGIGQILTAAKLETAALQNQVRSSRPASLSELADRLGSVALLLDDAIDAVHRIASELRPGILDELGLESAIEWWIEDFRKRAGVRCSFRGQLDDRPIGHDASTALFRIVQEAVANAARHSGASEVRIELSAGPRGIKLFISDNGHGIPPSKLGDSRSLGLIGMRERARTLGGDLTVAGRASGGTLIEAFIPS